MGEGFPADQALARLLSWGRQGKGGCGEFKKMGIGSMKLPQNPLRKGVGWQSCVHTGVDADVSLQRPRVGKLTLAVDTDVGFLPTVDPEMPFQVA